MTQSDQHLDGRAIHPLAALFPPMTEDEFAAIAADVAANGLVEPIMLLEGEILDGIHRLRGCLQAGSSRATRPGTARAARPSSSSGRRTGAAARPKILGSCRPGIRVSVTTRDDA